MFFLKAKSGRAKATSGGRRTRPRPLRPWVGFVLRLALLLGAAALIIGGATFILRSGWAERSADRATGSALRLSQKARFAVRDVAVEGRRYTDKNDLNAALSIPPGSPILALDPDAIRERVQGLPWVASVRVERILPDTIRVRLEEREPMARWQNDGKTVVVDREGAPIPTALPERFPALPLVVGPDAPAETPALLAALADFPAIAQALKGASRVGERRWDLHLAPRLTVQLPEQDIGAALAWLAKKMRDDHLLERPVSTVDLRVPGRMILTPESSAPRPATDVRP